MEQVDDNNEWFAMLDQIERDGADYHLEKMAELHALEVETEGRVRFIRITDDNPHGD